MSLKHRARTQTFSTPTQRGSSRLTDSHGRVAAFVQCDVCMDASSICARTLQWLRGISSQYQSASRQVSKSASLQASESAAINATNDQSQPTIT